MSCSTKAVAGYGGQISGPTGISTAEIVDWEMTVTIVALDATSMATDGWKEIVEGISSGSGSFKLIGNYLDYNQGKIDSCIFNTGTGSAASGGGTLSCSIIITSEKASTPVEGLVALDCTFETCGAVTQGAGS